MPDHSPDDSLQLPLTAYSTEATARRTFLRNSAMGLGSIALASMLQRDGHAGELERELPDLGTRTLGVVEPRGEHVDGCLVEHGG